MLSPETAVQQTTNSGRNRWPEQAAVGAAGNSPEIVTKAKGF